MLHLPPRETPRAKLHNVSTRTMIESIRLAIAIPPREIERLSRADRTIIRRIPTIATRYQGKGKSRGKGKVQIKMQMLRISPASAPQPEPGLFTRTGAC